VNGEGTRQAGRPSARQPSRGRPGGEPASLPSRGPAAAAGGRERSGQPGAPPDALRAEAPDIADLWTPFSPGPGQPASRQGRSGQRRYEQLQRAAGREPGRGRPRPQPALSKLEIVDAAIAVADADGADAVTMRRVAQILSAGVMSLYWHVANKEHLLDLMIDTVTGEIDVPEPTGNWRADLRAHALSQRAMLRRHPWVMEFIGGRPPLGPATAVYLERALALLDSLGTDVATTMNVLTTVATYVLGSALREAREALTSRNDEETGFSEEEIATWMAERRERLVASGRFPHFVRLIDDGVDPDAAETRDERFEFGLDSLLDGIAARLGGPPPPPARPPR